MSNGSDALVVAMLLTMFLFIHWIKANQGDDRCR